MTSGDLGEKVERFCMYLDLREVPLMPGNSLDAYMRPW